jgi:acyl-CoA thioesterase
MREPLALFYPILNLFPLAENIKRGKRMNNHDVKHSFKFGGKVTAQA